MEMRIQHLNILKRLSHAPCSLKTFTHAGQAVGNQGFHYERYLNELQNFGYAVEIGDVWHITGFGVAKLAEKKSPQMAQSRLSAGTTEGTYDGADLRRNCMREGAYDFLKYPSKFGENLVHPRVSL